jgi:hypothetical protein
MVSTLGDEHVPTTVVVTTEVDSHTVAPPNSVPDSALVPVTFEQPGFATSPGSEALLVVGYHVALMTVIIANYHSFSALLRTPIVQCPPRLIP